MNTRPIAISLLVIIALVVAQWQNWLPNSVWIRLLTGIVVVVCLIVIAYQRHQ
ncbi:hypothetical protein KIH77_01265 [Bifidobacterium sp. 82T24]|uniref:hypothetical protein n=1 Tax=Bifidobacterium pluvialisilvae TaxID=2834436 RepID=UPI001C56D0FC|nr:hypothetical protein [Bifidobacterium pluvialisilvae]MBW3087376.1 hypothetical protein [Bifidobacterium pluvialisilvae]